MSDAKLKRKNLTQPVSKSQSDRRNSGQLKRTLSTLSLLRRRNRPSMPILF